MAERFGVRLWEQRQAVTASSMASKTGWSTSYWVQLEAGQRQPPSLSQWNNVVKALTPLPKEHRSLQAALVLEGLFWEWSAGKENAAVILAKQVIAARGDKRIPGQLLGNEVRAQHTPRGKDKKADRSVKTELDTLTLDPSTWPRYLLVGYLCHCVRGLAINVDAESSAPLLIRLEPTEPGGKVKRIAISLA